MSASAATPDQPQVRLEGLYIAPDEAVPFPAGSALIDRAAVARLSRSAATLTAGSAARVLRAASAETTWAWAARAPAQARAAPEPAVRARAAWAARAALGVS